MIIVVHIVVALSSMVCSTYVAFSPSKTMLRINQGLIASTLGTGGYLIWAKPGHMLEICTVGLIYIGISLLCLAMAYKKLSSISN